ncbi:unconventional myosin-IXa-like, partial [Sphaerodactylus townsendi]|uniref:unconventional myosin-IXa-like n=1 Tax=Sphaerodactylus townsendi TaxID=933632 RepID=UPI0020261DE6
CVKTPPRAKMRFWWKGRHREKENTTEKLAPQSELLESGPDQDPVGREMVSGLPLDEELGQPHLTPPRSPELAGVCQRECKENKEPSPEVKRKRSLKTMNDLDGEECKKDTLMDVVFKKALEEFRQSIVSFYSILEQTVRLEQREWSESPVRVWVNTFQAFLDEYVTE